jgi:hypothetical protein
MFSSGILRGYNLAANAQALRDAYSGYAVSAKPSSW